MLWRAALTQRERYSFICCSINCAHLYFSLPSLFSGILKQDKSTHVHTRSQMLQHDRRDRVCKLNWIEINPLKNSLVIVGTVHLTATTWCHGTAVNLCILSNILKIYKKIFNDNLPAKAFTRKCSWRKQHDTIKKVWSDCTLMQRTGERVQQTEIVVKFIFMFVCFFRDLLNKFAIIHIQM